MILHSCFQPASLIPHPAPLHIWLSLLSSTDLKQQKAFIHLIIIVIINRLTTAKGFHSFIIMVVINTLTTAKRFHSFIILVIINRLKTAKSFRSFHYRYYHQQLLMRSQSEAMFVEMGECTQNMLSEAFCTPNIASSQFDEYYIREANVRPVKNQLYSPNTPNYDREQMFAQLRTGLGVPPSPPTWPLRVQ